MPSRLFSPSAFDADRPTVAARVPPADDDSPALEPQHKVAIALAVLTMAVAWTWVIAFIASR